MSDPQRREFLARPPASLRWQNAGRGAASRRRRSSFMNNVRIPLSRQGPATFKFALEKSAGKVIATVWQGATFSSCRSPREFAGVSMRLEPGAMRDLHWHATAAEWAFVIEGAFAPRDRPGKVFARPTDFDPGDVWYFPRGTATCCNAGRTPVISS